MPAIRRQPLSEQDWLRIRLAAVAKQIVDRGIKDPKVLDAMRLVPRHLFLPPEIAPALAYADRPLPIGFEQTISQPYIVAYAAEQLALTGQEIVLEIGSGCGYEAAVLSYLAKEVISVELIPELTRFAQENLSRIKRDNVVVRQGDGFHGCIDFAPFDRIIISAAVHYVPKDLLAQLSAPGKLIAPVGTRLKQQLFLYEKNPDSPNPPKIIQRPLINVAFVPMRGKIEGP